MSILASLVGLVLGACASTNPDGSSASPPSPEPAPLSLVLREDVVIADRPWSAFGIDGRMIETPSYRIFTTERDPLVARRIPVFLERALARYRVLVGDLPAPPAPMETYILATRSQWAALTQRLMGEQARVYLRIRAGGFASDGRALLFNIGSRGTFATAAHEGWHQFTQRSLRQPMPIWLEEGLATLMEGYRWQEDAPDVPDFLAWANVDRFDRLRDVVESGRAFTLADLLSDRPQDILTSVDNERALDYYAQVWALAHFLREAERARYRPALHELARDAHAGTLYQRIRQEASPQEFADLVRRRAGTGVFSVYFNPDLDEASRQYDAFLRTITGTGARDRIAAGESPLR